MAAEYILKYTDGAGTLSDDVGVEFYLRDSAFNRGPKGAVRTLQRALGLKDDGIAGPNTKLRLADAERDPEDLLDRLRASREAYERNDVRRDESSKFWDGLVNRWNKAKKFALELQAEVGPANAMEVAEASVDSAYWIEDYVDGDVGDLVAEETDDVAMASAVVEGPAYDPVAAVLSSMAASSVAVSPKVAMAAVASNDEAPWASAMERLTLPALRLGARGAAVMRWQTFLLGMGFDPGAIDGDFGDKTHVATIAFQQANGLKADGIVGRQSYRKAMDLGLEVFDEPSTDITGSNFPPRPSFGPLADNAARAAVFGEFKYVPAPLPGNKENIRILGTWEADNIVSVDIPQLRRALGSSAPSRMRVHHLASAQFKGLWAAWENAGLLDRVKSFEGAFNPRFIRGSTTKLSTHAFGCAFDINASTNGLGVRPPLVGERGSLRELVPLAHEWGFYWGGHFSSRQDGMHFEIAYLR